MGINDNKRLSNKRNAKLNPEEQSKQMLRMPKTRKTLNIIVTVKGNNYQVNYKCFLKNIQRLCSDANINKSCDIPFHQQFPTESSR